MTDHPVNQYLKAEFCRYFPEAVHVTVDSDYEAETIHVHVELPGDKPNHSVLTSWVMEVGSDDDRFIFMAADAHESFSQYDIITIPFPEKFGE